MERTKPPFRAEHVGSLIRPPALIDAREKAEKTLGAKFNIRAFHDAVLELGSVPLPVVTARIDRFIAEGGKGPYPDME